MVAKRSASEKHGGRREEPKTRQATVTATGTVPRLMLLGRGQLHGRKLHAIRIKPEVVDRLAAIATGPMYLLIELAINRLIKELESRPASQIEVLRAEDLG